MRVYPLNRWQSGTYKRECDICGWDYLRSELRKNSDGLIVCDADYEPEHPRDIRTQRQREKPFRPD